MNQFEFFDRPSAQIKFKRPAMIYEQSVQHLVQHDQNPQLRQTNNSNFPCKLDVPEDRAYITNALPFKISGLLTRYVPLHQPTDSMYLTQTLRPEMGTTNFEKLS